MIEGLVKASDIGLSVRARSKQQAERLEVDTRVSFLAPNSMWPYIWPVSNKINDLENSCLSKWDFWQSRAAHRRTDIVELSLCFPTKTHRVPRPIGFWDRTRHFCTDRKFKSLILNNTGPIYGHITLPIEHILRLFFRFFRFLPPAGPGVWPGRCAAWIDPGADHADFRLRGGR